MTSISSALTLTPYTLICYLRPNADTRALSQNWYELLVGCCGRKWIKSACDCLLSWDFIRIASPAWEKQTLLKRFKKTCSSKYKSSTEVRSSFRSLSFMIESYHYTYTHVHMYIDTYWYTHRNMHAHAHRHRDAHTCRERERERERGRGRYTQIQIHWDTHTYTFICTRVRMRTYTPASIEAIIEEFRCRIKRFQNWKVEIIQKI